MIKIMFFGSIADRLHQCECLLPAKTNMTLADVIAEMGCADIKPLLVAVNQEQVHDLAWL